MKGRGGVFTHRHLNMEMFPQMSCFTSGPWKTLRNLPAWLLKTLFLGDRLYWLDRGPLKSSGRVGGVHLLFTLSLKELECLEAKRTTTSLGLKELSKSPSSLTETSPAACTLVTERAHNNREQDSDAYKLHQFNKSNDLVLVHHKRIPGV